MRRSMEMRKAARVLPEPVGAEISVSRPEVISGQPRAWASVGAWNLRSNQVRMAGWNKGRVSSVISMRAVVAPLVPREPQDERHGAWFESERRAFGASLGDCLPGGVRTYVRLVYCRGRGDVNGRRGGREEAADGAGGCVRLLFEEEVAGPVDGDHLGAGEAFAEAGQDPAGKDTLVGGPEHEDGRDDSAAVYGLLTPHVSEGLVDGVAAAFDPQRASVGLEYLLRRLTRVVELAAEDAASEEPSDEPENRLD